MGISSRHYLQKVVVAIDESSVAAEVLVLVLIPLRSKYYTAADSEPLTVMLNLVDPLSIGWSMIWLTIMHISPADDDRPDNAKLVIFPAAWMVHPGGDGAETEEHIAYHRVC